MIFKCCFSHEVTASGSKYIFGTFYIFPLAFSKSYLCELQGKVAIGTANKYDVT